MTLGQIGRLGRGFAHKAAEFQLKMVTRQAVKKLKEQNEEVTVDKVISKFEGLGKLQEVGFEEEWIRKTIEKEMNKCI